ncbi:5215_t:CDS:1, partial [Gigaspora rosea]
PYTSNVFLISNRFETIRSLCNTLDYNLRIPTNSRKHAFSKSTNPMPQQIQRVDTSYFPRFGSNSIKVGD